MQSHAAAAVATDSVPILACITSADVKLTCVDSVDSDLWSSCQQYLAMSAALSRKQRLASAAVDMICAVSLLGSHDVVLLACMPTCHELAAWRGTSRCAASGPSSYSARELQSRC